MNAWLLTLMMSFAHLRIDRSEASLRDDVVLSSSGHVMSYVKGKCACWQHDETS